MIQCNVGVGHYPIIEIVLRVLVSDIQCSAPHSSLQPPADIILLDHDSRWQYTDWAHRRFYDPSSIHHALSKKYIYVGRYIHESMTKPTIYISQFLQEL